jgi:hypothetical protein
MHAIADAAEHIQAIDDASERGSTLALLREFCSERQLPELQGGDRPLPAGVPFRRAGRVWVHIDTFRRFCTTLDFPVERGALIQRFQAWGALRHTVAVRASPGRNSTRSMFGIPEELILTGDDDDAYIEDDQEAAP